MAMVVLLLLVWVGRRASQRVPRPLVPPSVSLDQMCGVPEIAWRDTTVPCSSTPAIAWRDTAVPCSSAPAIAGRSTVSIVPSSSTPAIAGSSTMSIVPRTAIAPRSPAILVRIPTKAAVP